MEKSQFDIAKESLDKFNSVAELLNLPKMILVSPKDCMGQEKNARYFSPEIFQQLTDNIKEDGRLESVPLVYAHESIEGKYRIISGHHRVDAAKQAKLEYIIVFLIEPKNRDEIISKQLSHNSLVGKDDKMILKELFDEISAIQLKIQSGIQLEIDKIDYTSLNFKIGSFKEVVLLFLPDEADKFESTVTELEKVSVIKSDSSVIMADIKTFDRFADCLRTIKKTQNIKSNPTGIAKMVEIVEQWIIANSKEEVKDLKQTKNGSRKKEVV